MNHRISLGPVTIAAEPSWLDITKEGEPLTLARADGEGALQFSFGIYKSGSIPRPSIDDLKRFLLEFAESRDLGKPFDVLGCDGEIRWVAGSFRADDDFIRAWYLYQNGSFCLATYVCQSGAEHGELPEIVEMMSTLRFSG